MFDQIYTAGTSRGARRARCRRDARSQRHSVLPGFDLALGFALLYLGLIVLIPLSAAFLKTFTMTWPQFWDAVSSPRVRGVVPADLRRLVRGGAAERAVRA